MTSLSARAPSSISPKGLTRAAYARKVFVASKTGYLTKKSGTELRESNGKRVMKKIKFMNYVVTKKRFFVLTGASLMYHRDHRKLDDPTSSKVCVVFVWCVCVCSRAQTSQAKK